MRCWSERRKENNFVLCNVVFFLFLILNLFREFVIQIFYREKPVQIKNTEKNCRGFARVQKKKKRERKQKKESKL